MAETGFRKKEGLSFKPEKKGLTLPLLLAAFGGVLHTLSWPWPGLWPLCFVALVPLLLAVDGQSGRRAFGLGWVYGMSLSLTSLPWIADVLVGYGGLGLFLGWLVTGLLAAVLAVYPALFAWITTLRVSGPVTWILVGSIAWCGLDWLKNWLFTGFNWTPLAGPLVLSPEMGQAADLFGFYGLGFFVALVNFLLAAAIFKRRDGCPKKGGPYLVAALFVVLAGYGYGYFQFDRWDKASAGYAQATVVAVQPSTPQDFKWDEAYRRQLLTKAAALARAAAAQKPWLVIWPETAMPFIFDHDYVESEWLRTLSRDTGGFSLVGLAEFSGFWPERKLHNRMILFNDGEPAAWYDKTHLVPFGEYVPFEDWALVTWLFDQGLLGAAGRFSAGHNSPLIEVPRNPDDPQTDQVRLGVLICFESIFPYLGRERVLEGAELLVVPTNDGWFGRSRAPQQHLIQAAMRAVETRRPLARVGNTGISAVIHPSGYIAWSSELYGVGAYPMTVPLPGRANLVKTFFVAWGYLLAPVLAVLTIFFGLFRFFRK